MSRYFRLLLGVGLVCAVVLTAGCGDDDKVLGPGDEQEADLNTWIWALDDATGTAWVHDADTGDLAATLTGQSHAMMRQVFAGPAAEPTVWMGKSGTAYAFTRGFQPHGDHVHMELPMALATIATGPSNTHQGVGDQGDYVVYANDGDQSFTVIDAETRTTRTVHHGSGHSAAFYADGHLVATDMHNKWVRVIAVDTDEVVFEAAIDTLAHGDAYHHASDTLFIATLNGFEVFDLESRTLGARISYPAAGRVNFLYHAGDVPVAFGPHKSEGSTDKIILLNMDERTTEALAIDGASLAWNVGNGNFAISENGKTVVATDLASPRAYVVCIDSENDTCFRSVLTVTVPAANMACAVNYAGDHVWALDKSNGTVYCYHPDEDELHNSWQVDAASDYIFATSVAAGTEVVKDF